MINPSNNCQFIGTLFKDIEMKVTMNNKEVVRNTISVRQGKDQTTGKTIYEYVPFVAYGESAKMLNTYFKKGKAIMLNCHFHTYKDNENNYRSEMVVDQIGFVPTDYVEKQEEQEVAQTPFNPYQVTSDELPF